MIEGLAIPKSNLWKLKEKTAKLLAIVSLLSLLCLTGLQVRSRNIAPVSKSFKRNDLRQRAPQQTAVVQHLATYEHEIPFPSPPYWTRCSSRGYQGCIFVRLFYASRVYFDVLFVWDKLCVCFVRHLDAQNRRMILLIRIMRLRLFPVFILTHNASQTNNASSKINILWKSYDVTKTWWSHYPLGDANLNKSIRLLEWDSFKSL